MEQAIKALKNRVSGQVVLPEDAAYDSLRQTKFNHTAQPLLIVECKTAADVAAGVGFARDNRLKLSVRSGGHSGAGLSTNDGGVVIDLKHLNQVDIIDDQRNIVRIGSGTNWGEVAKALQPHTLAISSGDTNSVGVGGLTLGGGIGWMVRTHGLCIDSLRAVELVTAAGEMIRATATENADLFWAVRGGGGNFGIATAFEFHAEPCTGIVGGKLLFDPANLETILTKWSDYMRTAPEELNSTVVLFPGFGPDAKPQVIVIVCYADHDETAAQKAIQPLRELAPAISDDIKPKPYADMLEDVPGGGALKIRNRNGFVRKITPELISALAENFGKAGTPAVQLRSLGGALSRVPADAMAFEHRDVEALLVMSSFAPENTPEEQANNNADNAWTPLKPFAHGAYIGFHTDNSEQSTHEAYEANRSRLAKIKATYDPGNLFDQNTNIKPAS